MPRRRTSREVSPERRGAEVDGGGCARVVLRPLDAFYRECAKSKISLIHLEAF